MILRISLLLFFLLIVPSAFIYVKQLRRRTSKPARLLFLLPNIILIVFTGIFMCTDDDISTHADAVGIYLIVLLFIALPEFLYALFLALSLLFGNVKIKRIFTITGLVLGILAAVLVVIGYVSCFTVLRVENNDFTSSEVPKAFDGYRIVHVSDLHLGTYHLFPNTVKRIVRTINAQQGNVIFFTGDLVNFSQKETKQFTEDLQRLSAPDGVFSVLGNHDYLEYVRYADETARLNGKRELVSQQRNAGWNLLLNENRVICRGNDSIYIVGSENDGLPPFPAKGDLSKALRNVPNDAFKILLSHDPTQWQRKVLPQTNIQLTLSGHTHAGQIKIFGWSPSSLVYNEWDGMYDKLQRVAKNGSDSVVVRRSLFISSGIGEALIPFRLGAWSKIDVITLHSCK